jgi:hypothetical protein
VGIKDGGLVEKVCGVEILTRDFDVGPGRVVQQGAYSKLSAIKGGELASLMESYSQNQDTAAADSGENQMAAPEAADELSADSFTPLPSKDLFTRLSVDNQRCEPPGDPLWTPLDRI